MADDCLYRAHVQRRTLLFYMLAKAHVDSGGFPWISRFSSRAMGLEELWPILGHLFWIKTSSRVCLPDERCLGVTVGHCDAIGEAVLISARLTHDTLDM